MQTEEDLIPTDQLCTHYQVEVSFINELRESGLIESVLIREKTFVPARQLGELEKIIRLHYDLDINQAGIEAIAHLLHRISHLQQHITELENRLQQYEFPEEH